MPLVHITMSAPGEAACSKRTILLISLLAVLLSFVACGGGPTAVVRNAPTPASSTVSIAFQPTPPTSVFTNSIVHLTAVVSNDPSDAGVDWVVTCPNSANCGSLIPLHTGSGQATTYTPPSGLAQNSETVTIVAFATADHTANTLTVLTVTGFAGILNGTYVLQTRGVDASGPYQFAGVAVFDGNGGITAGEQTYNNLLMSVSDAITGGSYFVGSDGRGTFTLNTADPKIGQQGKETFNLVVLSASQALIEKVDNPQFASASESATGSMDLQTSTAAPRLGYSFVVGGTDPTLSALAMGGVLNIDSPNTISGTGSVVDLDQAGNLTPGATVSGTISDPDPFGAVQLKLNTSFSSPALQFTGYLVDAFHIRLIETDNESGSGFGATGGQAIGQGAATGTFNSNSAFNGNYVFDVFGYVSGPGSATPASSVAAAGIFTADGTGNLSNGFADEFAAGIFVQISDNFSGTYSVAANGRVDTASSINFVTNGPGPELIFYLSGSGNPPLLLDADATLGSVGVVAVGTAYPAASTVTFDRAYGLSFTQSVAGGENDNAGLIVVDGNAQTVSGIADANLGFAPLPNTKIAGTFAPTDLPNRFTGQLSNDLFSSPITAAYYLWDSSHGFFVETDSAGLVNGYFATRKPACPGCP